MSAQNDFHLTLDRAARLADDTTCAVRAAGTGPLPQPHRALLSRALRKFESGQQDLFQARNNPWQPQSQTRPRQLELL